MPRLTARAKQALTEERQGQILDAAVRVFSARGYDGATIRRIARRAGLAEGTVYLYFSGKRELLVAAWEHLAVSSLLPLVDADKGGDDEGFLTAIVANRLDLLRRHPQFFRLMMQRGDVDPMLRRALQKRIQAIKALLLGHIRRRIAEGAFRRVPLPIIMRVFAGGMIGTALLEATDPESIFDKYPLERIAREVARLFLYGLTARGERARAGKSRRGVEQ